MVESEETKKKYPATWSQVDLLPKHHAENLSVGFEALGHSISSKDGLMAFLRERARNLACLSGSSGTLAVAQTGQNLTSYVILGMPARTED